jgi:hypothetical protein
MPVPDFSPGEVLTAAAMDSIGLWLVKSQTIGTGVSSVTVTGAFSADYDNYKIIVTGGVASATNVLNMTLGSTSTGYYYGGLARTYLGSTLSIQLANGGNWYAGEGTVNSLIMNANVFDPFNAKNTVFTMDMADTRADGYWLTVGGYLADTTSYTSFTLTASAGTLTGGTIRVYGFRN